MENENLNEIRDKPLCDYGCDQEANYQFKNGKWCCSKSQNSCKGKRDKNPPWNKGISISEETKLKISEANKGNVPWMLGKTHSKESRRKISKSLKGNIPWNKGKRGIYSKKSLRKMSEGNLGKVMSDEARKKISETLTGVPRSEEAKNSIKISIERIKEKYPTFSKVEEMRYEPGKENERVIQVHCKNHNCKNSKEKGGWFTPKRRDFEYRIGSIERDSGNDAGYIYCSNKCKEECPLFNKKISQLIKEDQINAGIINDLWYTSAEYALWRSHIFNLDNNKCVYCDKPAEHAHHILPQKTHPELSLDPDNGISCCQECHFKYGHRDKECFSSNLSKLVCERIIRIKNKLEDD